MNLKTLYELQELIDLCEYYDTLVEDLIHTGIDIETLAEQVNKEKIEFEKNVYPNLSETNLLNKENVTLLGEDTLAYFEKTLEEWDQGIIDYNQDTLQLFHKEGKTFSHDVITWYEGGISTEDLVDEYRIEKETNEKKISFEEKEF